MDIPLPQFAAYWGRPSAARSTLYVSGIFGDLSGSPSGLRALLGDAFPQVADGTSTITVLAASVTQLPVGKAVHVRARIDPARMQPPPGQAAGFVHPIGDTFGGAPLLDIYVVADRPDSDLFVFVSSDPERDLPYRLAIMTSLTLAPGVQSVR